MWQLVDSFSTHPGPPTSNFFLLVSVGTQVRRQTDHNLRDVPWPPVSWLDDWDAEVIHDSGFLQLHLSGNLLSSWPNEEPSHCILVMWPHC